MPETNNEQRAKNLQSAANLISLSRLVAGPLIFGYAVLSPQPRGWLVTIILGGLFLGDNLDGWLSRRAVKFGGPTVASRGGRLDEQADKVLFHLVLAGITAHEATHGNSLFASLLVINQAVALGRDIVVSRARNRADKLGLNTQARRLGKVKTWLYSLALGMAYSPLAVASSSQNITLGQWIVTGLLSAGGTLSVIGGIQLARQLRRPKTK